MEVRIFIVMTEGFFCIFQREKSRVEVGVGASSSSVSVDLATSASVGPRIPHQAAE